MSDPLHIWSADRLLVCVPADLPPGVIGAVRALFAGEPTVDAALEVLTAGGLAATPPFVCAAAVPAGVRVVIRGELQAVAHGRDGSSLTLGAGQAATWNDDVVTDISSISVDPGGGRIEWIAGAATGPVPAAPDAPPVVEPVVEPVAPPVAPPVRELHTLDEQEFERVVAAAQAPEPEVEAPAPDPAPAGDVDFSGLLEPTGHGAAAPAPADDVAPTPAPAPAAPPPPADPTLPSGVVPPRPASRPPISSVPAAGASAPPPRPPEPPAAPGTGLGEHDGRTVTLADLRRIQEQAAAERPPAAAEGDGAPRAGQVRAVRCPVGHANPPTAVTCRLCDAAIADSAVVTVPRPVVARLVFDSGLVVDVDRPQLIGRRPSAPPEADEIPGLVTLPSPDSDISRAHTAVRVEGWDVLVEDVGSTNGTEVRLPNRDPVRLREHDPVLVVVGTEVTLAGTVRFRVEGPER